jgi:hypothetical protein
MLQSDFAILNIARLVAANIPPGTVQPMVFLATELAPEASARGRTPNRNAMDVMRIGRNLSLTASKVAGSGQLEVVLASRPRRRNPAPMTITRGK